MDQTDVSSIASIIAISIAFTLYLLGVYGIVLSYMRRKAGTVGLDYGVDNNQHLFVYEGPERRIYPRADFDADIRYRTYGGSSGVNIFKEGKAVDISEGGIGILMETSEKLFIEDVLELKLKLPIGPQFMLIRGKIIWAKELEKEKWYRYGVSFTDIDSSDKKLISKYVDEHKSEMLDGGE